MSPKSKEEFEAIRQRSREAIKTTALELFAANGYSNTSISMIAKEAGISKGLMYNYFDSKQQLLHTILEEAVEGGAKALEHLFDSGMDPLEEIVSIVKVSFSMIEGNLQYWKFMTSLALQDDVIADIKVLLEKKQELIIDHIFELFEKVGAENPKLEAYQLGATLDGIMMHYITLKNGYPLDKMEAYIIEDLIRKYKAKEM